MRKRINNPLPAVGFTAAKLAAGNFVCFGPERITYRNDKRANVIKEREALKFARESQVFFTSPAIGYDTGKK